jgi:hypothetical protein
METIVRKTCDKEGGSCELKTNDSGVIIAIIRDCRFSSPVGPEAKQGKVCNKDNKKCPFGVGDTVDV